MDVTVSKCIDRLPMNFDITCVIFAGGKSSRMGQNKALLPFDSCDSLIEYQYNRLSKLFQNVYISAKASDTFSFDAKIIPDVVGTEVYAPTAGFVAAFTHLNDERLFILSVDAPFVDTEEIQSLLDADSPQLDAVVARTATGIHPMCGIYHRSLLPTFETMLTEGNHRLGQMLSQSEALYVPFDDETAFTNLNHPHEYEAARLLNEREKNTDK